MLFWRKIRPANGYCLFFPKRTAGGRFVSGQSVRVGPFEEWKHVKLGLFHVALPGQEQLLVVTREQLSCGIKASFGIVIGGPAAGREDRMAKATLSCPANRSMDERVELVPFFQEWARNYCRTAIVNTIKGCEYIRLIEEPEYRQKAEAAIEEFAKKTLDEIGMMLVQCTVVVEPSEPAGVFATPEIRAKWEQYQKTVSAAELSKLRAENSIAEAKVRENAEHERRILNLTEEKKQQDAVIIQATDIGLRQLALEMKRAEAVVAIEEQQELSKTDSRVSEIKREMADRALEAQLQRIRRETEQGREEGRKAKELADLKRQQEAETLAHRQSLLAEERLVAEKELEVVVLRQKMSAVEVEVDRSKGEVKAQNVEKEVLARGAHEMKMRQLLFAALPTIVEQASRPIEKMGEIRSISNLRSSRG